MSQQKMRWKPKDYMRLEKAVNDFNNKVTRLQKQENRSYLPDLINAEDVKKEIYTKYELNRVLNSLRAFSEKGAENLYKTEAGEELTIWEKQQLTKASRIRENQLKKELEKFEKPNNQGISKVQMGNTEAKRIQANIDRLKQFEQKIR